VDVWLQMTNYSYENANKITTGITEKKKMPKLWSCIVPKNDDARKRKQIDKQINAKLKQDGKVYKATYRLLLLGLIYFLYSLIRCFYLRFG
jgi:hypothetical protein